MERERIVYVERVKPTEIVIEEYIIKAIYSEHQDIFRNKSRFQMILSQPTKGFHFKQVKGIYKGKFICGNENCLQKKTSNEKKQKRKLSQQSNRSDRSPNHPSWLAWWNTQQSTIKPSVKYEEEQKSEEMPKKAAKKGTKSKTANLKNGQNGQNYIKNPKTQKDPQYQNSRWSSSLSYVIFNYCSRPAPLDQLLQVYDNPERQKIQIFIYVELMGQKCQKCMNAYKKGEQIQLPGFEYPFFGKTELKRIRKNFSSYIYNKIHGKEIKRYRPCELKELQDHKEELCQACKKGTCRKAVRRRKDYGRRAIRLSRN